MINIELIKKVQKLISILPDAKELNLPIDTERVWDQGEWCHTSTDGEENICQTAACAAGWIVILAEEEKGIPMADTIKAIGRRGNWDGRANAALGVYEGHPWDLDTESQNRSGQYIGSIGTGEGPLRLYSDNHTRDEMDDIFNQMIEDGAALNAEEAKT
jgi:hypothetical protein